MAVTLTYDDRLARVRAAITGLVDVAAYRLERSTDQVRWTTVRGAGALTPASGSANVDDYEFAPGVENFYRVVGPSAFDTFTRTVAAGGWGSASSGQAWTSAAQMSVNGTTGLVTHDAANQSVLGQLAPTGLGKVAVMTDIRLPVVAAVGAFETGVTFRRVDGSNYYLANVLWDIDGTLLVQLIRNVGGTFTTLDSRRPGITYTGSQAVRVRVEGDGPQLRVRVWLVGGAEPDSWTVQGVDSTHAAGQVGFRSRRGSGNTNGTTATHWDNFLVLYPEAPVTSVTTTSPWLTDTFSRTVSNGWGTADTGNVWTTHGGSDPSHWGVSGGVGWHDAQRSDVTKRSLTAGPKDGEAEYTFSIPVKPSGEAPQSAFIVREDGTNSQFYLFRWILTLEGEVEMRISARNGADEFTIANDPGTYGPYGAAGSLIHCKCRWQGPFLAMKTWVGSNPEPVGWQLSVLDTRYSAAGRMGLRSTVGTFWQDWTGPVPLRFSYDNLTVTEIQATSITPAVNSVWLKSLARPFLNRAVIVSDVSEVTRPARTGTHQVMGRSLPVAVSDVRGGRQWTMSVLTTTDEQTRDLEMLLASGDVLLVQVPAGSRVPAGYVAVGDTSQQIYALNPVSEMALPLTEAAPPGPDVVGATSNWQSVLNAYASWADLLAAHPTWASVLELVGSPTDVVVP